MKSETASLAAFVLICGYVQDKGMCSVCMSAVPHQVVVVVAVPAGWAVYVAPLWRHERVGLVWRHEQIWNHNILLVRKSGEACPACSMK